MLTTPLLSLSVHETLTFEGTTIALHPDLFRDGSQTVIVPGQGPGGGSSVIGNIGMAASVSGGDLEISGTRPTSSKSCLEVGTMLEIHVWDPLPTTTSTRSPKQQHMSENSPTTLLLRSRRKSPVPTPIPMQPSLKANSSNASMIEDTPGNSTALSKRSPTTVNSTSTMNTLEAAASSLQMSFPSYLPSINLSSVASLQYSIESEKGSENPNSKSNGNTTRGEHDASTLSSTERTPLTDFQDSPKSGVPTTVLASGGLPPLPFPRNRANTGDLPSKTNSPAAPSLPFPRNRANTGDLPPKANSPTAFATAASLGIPKPLHSRCTSSQTLPSPATLSPSAKRMYGATSLERPRHVRDISDMTTDIALAASLVTGVTSTSDMLADLPSDSGFVSPSPSLDNSSLLLGLTPSHSLENCNDAMAAAEVETEDVLDKVAKTHQLRLSFVVAVTEKTFSIKESARTQVSLLRAVADLYNLSSYDIVTITKIESEDEPSVLEEVSADFVVVTIKQFVSRGELHYFQKSLLGRYIYEGQRVIDSKTGVKCHAIIIRHANRVAQSGFITSDTVITFRSRSARIIYLVQICSEMWDYASPYEKERWDKDKSCEIYFDKFVTFMRKLFEKWKELDVTHSLTVIFFSRTFIGSARPDGIPKKGLSETENVDVYGRLYDDHYKTVLENDTSCDWDYLLHQIKSEFVKYPFDLGWNLDPGNEGRRPSSAMQGNVLEAINVTLNLQQYHYMDRDLERTGNSIVIVSPGCGVFEVDKGLAGVTQQRMMDDGIGSDMLSLGLPPLHTAPFFMYNNAFYMGDTDRVDAEKTYYEVPHWMHLSFVSYDEEEMPDITDTNLLSDLSRFSHLQPSNQSRVEANGFLVPSVTLDRSMSERMLSPTIATASYPTVDVSHQRSLIEGRDFEDILEACRPRNASNALPSSLKSLLQLHRHVKEVEKNTVSARNKQLVTGQVISVELDKGPKSDILEDTLVEIPSVDRVMKEWGSVDFDEIGGSRILSTPSQVPGDKGSQSLIAMDSPVPSDSSDVKSSPSSSFASIYSHIISRHPERVPIGSYASSNQLLHSTSFNGMQMQRSVSVEFSAPESETDETLLKKKASDDSLSTLGTDVLNASTSEEVFEGEDYAEYLRTIMSHHDITYFNPKRVSEHHPVAANPPTHTPKQSGGGIGAAIVQYNDSDGHINTGMKRIRSVGVMPTVLNGPFQQLTMAATSFSSAFVGMPLGLETPEHSYRSRGLGIPDEAFSVGMLSPDGALSIPRMKPLLSGNSLAQAQPSSGQPANLSHGGTCRAQKTNSRKQIGPPKISNIAPIRTTQNSKKKSLLNVRNRGSPSRSFKPRTSSQNSRQKKSVFNPFRQQEWEEVLAKKTHNRRRWSHVFPRGEIEFKRYAGPNWKSLCQPAILPLTIDFHPSPQELCDQSRFYFNPYSISLTAIEDSVYTSHSQLLQEMVLQRITQDYQVVPQSVINESTIRGEAERIENRKFPSWERRPPFAARPASHSVAGDGVVQHTLSMGHKIHVLTYKPDSDTIEVVQYYASSALHDKTNVYKYFYLQYSQITQKYTKVLQTFEKYSKVSRWNQIDNMICGDSGKSFSDEMNYRRVMFALIPQVFHDVEAEHEYVGKFKKLLEYLSKLSQAEGSAGNFDINIVLSTDARPDRDASVKITIFGTKDRMKRFIIDLRKGKQDRYEWMEIAMDPSFDTTCSFRIMVNWLVASASKVETQVQLLLRRSTQYGLNLISIPQISMSGKLFLHPFVAPPMTTIRDKDKAVLFEDALLKRDFVNDGIHITEPQFMDVVKGIDEFQFSENRRIKKYKAIPARQYVHRSGSLFVRLIRDEQGWLIAVAFENTTYIGRDASMRRTAIKKFQELTELIDAILK